MHRRLPGACWRGNAPGEVRLAPNYQVPLRLNDIGRRCQAETEARSEGVGGNDVTVGWRVEMTSKLETRRTTDCEADDDEDAQIFRRDRPG